MSLSVILLILVIVLIIGVFLLYQKVSALLGQSQQSQQDKQQFDKYLSELDIKLEERLRSVKDQVVNTSVSMQNSTTEVNTRLTQASKVIGDLQSKIASFEEGSKRIYDIGKDITELQNILKAPKLRGGLGESFLESLLSQVLPKDMIEFQYRYKSGDIVDAIVKFPEYFLPIDAKFPYENYKKYAEAIEDKERETYRKELVKNVKKHIDDIATKYIAKEEHSLELAFMYIPAENIYYDLVISNNDSDMNVREYASAKRVIPVSPSTLYAYLQIVLLGLRGMQVSRRAREILDVIKTLESEFATALDAYQVVGKHLNDAQKKYGDSEKQFTKFQNRLDGAIALGDVTEVDAVEAPDSTQGALPIG